MRSTLDRRHYAAALAVIATLLTAYRIVVIAHLGIDLYVDEAYYWGWSRALDWGYFSKPPLIAALIRASTTLFGDGLIAIKLPSLLLYPATAAALFALGARLYSAPVGFWAGLLFMAMPLVAALGLFVSTDAPLLLCWALALFYLLRALDQDKGWGDWLRMGVALGVGLMAKYTMAAFLPSALLLMLTEPRGRRWLLRPQPWLALVLALALFSPNLYWNWLHDFPTFRHTAEITDVGDRGWRPAQLLEFIGAQWLSFGPLTGVLLGWALFKARWARPAERTLTIFLLPLLLLVCVQALTGRANGNWAAPIFVAACVLVPGIFLATRRRLLIAGVALNLFGAMVAYHWPDVARLADIPLTAKTDPFKRARGWSLMAEGVRPYLDAHPEAILVAEDRELVAHLVYHLHPAEYAAWAWYGPQAAPMDHYQLVTTLVGKEGRDVLYVGNTPEVPAQTPHFASTERLAKIVVPLHPDFKREVYVYLLKGFKGY